MAIAKIDNFQIFKPSPIDSRTTKATIVERDAIPSGARYEGLEVYVAETLKKYFLKGGITNSDWFEGSGSIDADRGIAMIPEGVNLGDANMSVADFLSAVFFYDPPIINSFTGGTTYQIGELNRSTMLSFNVTAPTRYAVQSITISATGYYSGDISVGGTVLVGAHSITPGADTNTVYTLTVTSTQSGISATDTETISFMNYVYYGASVVGTYNETFIKALSGKAFDSNYSHSFSATAGTNQYIYYAVPKDYTSSPHINPPYFWIGGFQGGFEIAQNNISYTYGGNTENYTLYKSVNHSIGTNNVVVQTT